jgi:hypothetical protein
MKRLCSALAFVAAVAMTPVWADSMESMLTLAAAGPSSGNIALTTQSGMVVIEVDGGQTTLTTLVSGLKARSVYTVWLVFDTTQPPFIMGDSLMAVDDQTSTVAPVLPFTPAAADSAGFVAGNGLDPNGFVTDDKGNAQFQVRLNYDITQPRSAPLLLRLGTTQALPLSQASGGCVAASDGTSYTAMVDTGYMRVFDKTGSMAAMPSFQLADAPLKPRLIRGTVASIVLAEHLDGLTHGHVPGVVIGSSAPCGDWVPRLLGALSAAQ